jgi:hypothetical protein
MQVAHGCVPAGRVSHIGSSPAPRRRFRPKYGNPSLMRAQLALSDCGAGQNAMLTKCKHRSFLLSSDVMQALCLLSRSCMWAACPIVHYTVVPDGGLNLAWEMEFLS